MDPLAYANSYLDEGALCPGGGGALPRVTLCVAVDLAEHVQLVVALNVYSERPIAIVLYQTITNFINKSQVTSQGSILRVHGRKCA